MAAGSNTNVAWNPDWVRSESEKNCTKRSEDEDLMSKGICSPQNMPERGVKYIKIYKGSFILFMVCYIINYIDRASFLSVFHIHISQVSQLTASQYNGVPFPYAKGYKSKL